MADQENPRWLSHLLAEVRRAGVRLDDPTSLRTFATALQRHIASQAAARGQPDPDGLEPWQRTAAANFYVAFWEVAAACLPRVPRSALMLTFLGDGEEPLTGAIDTAVEIQVTTASGKTITVRPAALVEAGMRMRRVKRVETVGPSLGYILWVGRWLAESPAPQNILLAWDLRGVFATAPDAAIDELLARLRGISKRQPARSPGWFARQDREVVLRSMPKKARRRIMREALEEHMLDPETRRLPLRGLIRAGASAIWDAGGSGLPFDLLRKLSALLREERRREILLDALPEQVSEDVNLERLIADETANLPTKSRKATEHYLRATLSGVDLKTYCEEQKLSYEAVSRAARRGLDRLREKK